jgi:hypothetical protein
LALIPGARIDVFGSLVFIQAGIQRIALLIDTVTEVLAGVLAASALAPVGAFNSRIAGPDVVQKLIDDND